MNPAPRVRDLLGSAGRQLASRLEAELLLGEVLGRDRAWLYAHGDHPCPEPETTAFDRLLERRLAGEPIAYILGRREFYGRDFRVGPDVLIPRPETELLIDLALALALPDQATVLDIGTGSGCIALTLALERPDWQVTAVDLSHQALAVAACNRRELATDNVALRQGNLFDAIGDQRFDLVVSNPPYVADDDVHLKRGDLRFEPALALSTGNEGLALIERIIATAPDHLDNDGWLLLEHGHDQAEKVRRHLAAAGFGEVRSCRDLADIERASLGRVNRPA